MSNLLAGVKNFLFGATENKAHELQEISASKASNMQPPEPRAQHCGSGSFSMHSRWSSFCKVLSSVFFSPRATKGGQASAAMDKVVAAMGKGDSQQTINALKELKDVVQAGPVKMDDVVKEQLLKVGKKQGNALQLVQQFCSSNPWNSGHAGNGEADDQLRQFHADLTRKFEQHLTKIS